MKSIRRGLTHLLLLHLILTVIAAGLVCWIWARYSVLDQFDATLRARAELIMATVEEDDGNLEVEFDLTKVAELGHGEDLYFQIRSGTGDPLITSENFTNLRGPSLTWSAMREPQFQFFELPDHRSFRAMQLVFDAGDDAQGKYRNLHLLIVREAEEIHQALNRLAFWVLVVGLLSVLCLWIAVRCSLQKGLQPLEDLARRTGDIDLKQLPLQQLPLAQAPSELRPMAEKLNELLQRVHESLLRERRFTRDVAHELRTPVAELKIIAELAADWSDQADPETIREIKGIATEMESLVASLTLLNRLDAGTVAPESSPTAVSQVLRQLLVRYAPAMTKKKLQLHVQISPDPMAWETDPVLWKIAATNLIGNAVTHSPANSEIRLHLTDESLTVQNSACSLTAEDVQQMTLPFWRKESARSGQAHSGLGLSLVESIARALELQLNLSLSPERQLVVSLRKRSAIPAFQQIHASI